MGEDIKSTDFQTKVLSSITDTADSAYQQMLAKREQYEAAKKQLSIFTAVRNQAAAKFQSAKQNAKNGNDYAFRTAKAEYNSASSSYSNADINVDVLRFSLQDAISYSGKMGNCAALANAMIG